MRFRTLAIAALALALSACSALAFGTWDVVRGNGTIRLESREVAPFDGIANQGSGLVRFSQGATRQVTVEADANILPYLETEVRDGVLVLRTRPGTSISPTRLVYRITAPDLHVLRIQGSGDARMETPLDADRLEIEIEGSGSFSGRLNADTLAADIEGSGGIALSGGASSARFAIEGSGSIDAADLTCVDAEAVIRGSGSVTLTAARSLDVGIYGSGDVRWRGGATVTVRDAGSGSLRQF